MDAQSNRTAKVGDIVGYMMEYPVLQVRPAIVVHNWSEPPHEGTLLLRVFTDGDGSSYNDGLPNVVWTTSVMYDERKQPGTWHWIG